MRPDPEGPDWQDPLAVRLAPDADAAQVAESVAALWAEIQQALHPILGHRGVAALYSRSLALCAADHPWLSAGQQGLLASLEVQALRVTIAAQSASAAALGSRALFRSFLDLLASLVGASLTERLLRPVWALPFGASNAQDPSP